MIDLNKIKPEASGKYSPLLYKWLTHKRRKPWNYKNVFQCHNRIDGNGYYDHWRAAEFIIGHGDFCEDGKIVGIGGRSIRDIICGQRGVLTQGFHYGPGLWLRDVTEEFWATYERIGRCTWDHIHGLHMIGDENRWHYITGGRKRECNWCGHIQEKIEGKWVDYKSSKQSDILHPMGSMGEYM